VSNLWLFFYEIAELGFPKLFHKPAYDFAGLPSSDICQILLAARQPILQWCAKKP
jgi:hypothetical protein